MSDDVSADATIAEKRDPLIGTLFDSRFEIEARLAAGGFGAIYRAKDTRNGRDVALKVLHPNLVADKSVVARFRREGRVMTSLRDPHTLAAYELGEAPDKALYIVMELLRGQTLFERIRERGSLPWEQAVAIARAICSSLSEAHKRGIVHRDLKPPNIFLQRRGESDFVKVLDFGIAKIMRGSDIDRTQLTNAGFTVGTVEYMSPEQIQGELCTERSDIYSLGLVLYEMMTGHRPFANSPDLVSMLTAMLERQLPRLSMTARVPPEVERIVMRCLAPEPKDRYKDVEALVAAIERLATNQEPDTRTGRGKTDEEQPTWFDPRSARRSPQPQAAPPPAAPTIGEEATMLGTFAALIQPPQQQVAKPPMRPSEPPMRPSPLQPPTMRPSEPRAMRPSEPPLWPTPLQPMPQPPPQMIPQSATMLGPPMPGPPMQPMPGQMVPPGQQMMSPMPGQLMAPGQQMMSPMPGQLMAPGQQMMSPMPGQLMAPGQQMMSPMPGQPMAPGPPANRGAPGPFDMSAAAQRDAWVRRIVWITVAVVLGIIGLVIAARR